MIVGKYYSVEYHDHLWIYGKCVGKIKNVSRYSIYTQGFGRKQTKYEFTNCIVYNENDDTCYKVINQVELWQNFIENYTPIKPDAEQLIYLLSKHIPNDLDTETVTLIASFVKHNMKEIEYYSSPTFDALDIYGSVTKAQADEYKGFESDEDEDEADYGGAKRNKIKSRKYKQSRKNKTIKSYKN
jgi:hypothetical protein